MDPRVEKRPPTPFPALIRRLETQSGVVAKTLITPAIVDATTLSSGLSPPPPSALAPPAKGFAAPPARTPPRALRRRRLDSKAACDDNGVRLREYGQLLRASVGGFVDILSKNSWIRVARPGTL